MRPYSNLLAIAALAVVAVLLPQAQAQDRISPNLANPAPRPRVALADRIVAVVNDEVITMRELEERLRLVKAQLVRQRVAAPPDDVLEKQVLERMIMDRAQVQFARESSMRVDESQLDRAIGRIAEENRMSLTQFRDTLERDGVSFARFREDIRADILISRIRDREVDSRV